MLDPYLVLGVGKYDDDQTVKKAYRQLSKQYHPDNNINNPNKDAAEETFKKIQLAYEQIMHERSLGIGGPDDIRRKNYENNETSRASASYGYKEEGNSFGYGSAGTAQKERTDHNRESGFWNSGFWNRNDSDSYYSGESGTGGSGNGNAGNAGNAGSAGSAGSNGNNGYYSGNYNENYGRYQNTGQNYYSGYNSGYSSYGSSYNNGYGGNSNYYTGGQNAAYSEDMNGMLNKVADKLNNRQFFEAWDMLNSMSNKNDVWYYYSAIANLGLGNSITALSHVRTAKEMNPDRPEYDELINGIQSGTLHYKGKSEMFVPQKSNGANICLKLIIANVALNIFCGGGGMICRFGFCF